MPYRISNCDYVETYGPNSGDLLRLLAITIEGLWNGNGTTARKAMTTAPSLTSTIIVLAASQMRTALLIAPATHWLLRRMNASSIGENAGQAWHDEKILAFYSKA